MHQRRNAAIHFACLVSCLCAHNSFVHVGMAQEDKARLASEGHILFMRTWTVKDPLCPTGDGLGPTFNERSCVACHFQGGVGGGGPNEKNVDLLSIGELKTQSEIARNQIRKKTDDIHPLFAGSATTMLHRFHVSTHFLNNKYELWRMQRLGLRPPTADDAAWRERARALLAKRQQNPSVEIAKLFEIPLRISHRSTPALFGAALIDAIPDDVIREEAAVQKNRNSKVAGRVPPANSLPAPKVPQRFDLAAILIEPRVPVGRFGWRGQTASLREFVLGACANELGLEVPDHPQGKDPFKIEYTPPGLDLTMEQCDQLIVFVASLPRPQQIMPDIKEQVAQVDLGERIFERVGCAACHVKKLGNVDGLYSDLLLHDMGPNLADPVPANPDVITNPPIARIVQTTYFGAVTELIATESQTTPPVSTRRQEWRTPPLWGVRDSGPYLHDGRARTLEDAIALHGGEATSSVHAYQELSRFDRERLVKFLNTLAAPDVAH